MKRKSSRSRLETESAGAATQTFFFQAAHVAAETRGAKTMFLEVAEDNHAARALYQNFGFAMVGRRPGYYARKEQTAMDALILSVALSRG